MGAHCTPRISSRSIIFACDEKPLSRRTWESFRRRGESKIHRRSLPTLSRKPDTTTRCCKKSATAPAPSETYAHTNLSPGSSPREASVESAAPAAWPVFSLVEESARSKPVHSRSRHNPHPAGPITSSSPERLLTFHHNPIWATGSQAKTSSLGRLCCKVTSSGLQHPS